MHQEPTQALSARKAARRRMSIPFERDFIESNSSVIRRASNTGVSECRYSLSGMRPAQLALLFGNGGKTSSYCVVQKHWIASLRSR
jgi:hypothetical protein